MKGQILFKRLALAVVVVTATVACGQKGALYLPTEPAARDRASLPEALMPNLPSKPLTEPVRQP
jgi:predicted small lipoprotein YifL